MFKLRFYKNFGVDRGNLDHEEYFECRSDMVNRYREVFEVFNDGMKPTAWILNDGKWERLSGY